jgi:hypothetical protein
VSDYRERLSANANDFDGIVSEILAENESLRHQLADATRKLEEARKDAERWAEFMRNTKFSIWYWCGSGKAPNKPISNAEAIALIDQAIEQGKGGDDE